MDMEYGIELLSIWPCLDEGTKSEVVYFCTFYTFFFFLRIVQ